MRRSGRAGHVEFARRKAAVSVVGSRSGGGDDADAVKAGFSAESAGFCQEAGADADVLGRARLRAADGKGRPVHMYLPDQRVASNLIQKRAAPSVRSLGQTQA